MAEPLRPPPPPAHGAQTEALRAFSEALFKANDYVPDGLLLSINEAAMNLHKACSQPASATRSSDILERVRGQMYTNIAELHELREVNANYSEQLHSATMVIDKLRERRDYFAKCTAALKGVCIANNIADCKLLEAYDRLGVLQKVLEERERKRRLLSKFLNADVHRAWNQWVGIKEEMRRLRHTIDMTGGCVGLTEMLVGSSLC